MCCKLDCCIRQQVWPCAWTAWCQRSIWRRLGSELLMRLLDILHEQELASRAEAVIADQHRDLPGSMASMCRHLVQVPQEG